MRTLLLLLMLIFVVSCNNDDDNNPEFQPTEIAFTEVGRGSLLGNGDEGISESILLINTDTDWQNLMTQMNINGNTTAGFSETDIDFETYSIIAVFLDVKLTSWYLEITNIIENETNITVTIDEYQPIIFLNSITQPFHIVKIPKTDKPIVLD
ncbi:hypothetical protein [uncultured Winogradskyella sp.]|uniref:hypothetical protein n=1 Tax=uncultured Winogradskyella sp. TaxID=395353 RepID=UPI0030D91B98